MVKEFLLAIGTGETSKLLAANNSQPPMSLSLIHILLKKVPSRYELVNVVACRARKIASEAETAGVPLDDKPVSIAIREVAEGKLDQE